MSYKKQFLDTNKMLSDEQYLIKKYCSKWLMNLMNNYTDNSSEFFDVCLYVIGNPKDVVSSIVYSIEEYLSTHKTCNVDKEEFERLKICNKNHISDILESLLEDTPELEDCIKQAIYRELENNLDISAKLTGKKGCLTDIKRLFALDKKTLEMLYFIYATKHFEPCYDYFRNDLYIFQSDHIELLSSTLGIDESTCKVKLDNLVSMGIINPRSSGYGIIEPVLKSIRGIGSTSLQSLLCSPIKKSTIPLSDFNVSNEDTQYILNMFSKKTKDPVNLMIYGDIGLGKSEYARAICRELEVKGFEVRANDSEDSRRANLVAAIQIANRTTNSIVICDECDDIIQTFDDDYDHPANKYWLNSILEQKGVRIIWIINDPRKIEDSTKRRFSYSLKFTLPPPAKKIALYEKIASKLHCSAKFPTEEVKKLVKLYNNVPVSAIEAAIRQAKVVSNKSTFISCVHRYLKSYTTFINNGKDLPNMTYNGDSYLIDGINSDIPIKQLLEKVRHLNSLLESGKSRPGSTNIMFFGPSGSSKSESAKYIAHMLDKPCLTARGSDIISMWHGASEQNLRALFDEAAATQSVLLLDEFDTFTPGHNSLHHFDVQLNNEFLLCLENSRCICICTTNFRTEIASNFMRRFSLKVKFNYLTSDQISYLYEKVLSPLVELPVSNQILESLKKHKSLAPGDFYNVYNQYIADDTSELSHDNIINSLIKEERLKLEAESKKLGF